ncbi:MAG: roadblock/LC7 domain-containing protein [Candidatus Altiarchaeota archaeon]|nr:roadblock/LC7 domain-containing protein [Candidatus Altiarchaeota archaeon]
MYLPKGIRLKHGDFSDLPGFCRELPSEFNGAITFYTKYGGKFYEGNMLIMGGKIVASSIKNLEDDTELTKEESLEDIKKKMDGAGDVDIYSFNDVDMWLSVEHNPQAFLKNGIDIPYFLEGLVVKPKTRKSTEDGIADSKKHGRDEGMRKRFKAKIDEWRSKGYDVLPLESVIDYDLQEVQSTFKKFEFDIKVLQRIEEQLNSFDTAGFEDDVRAIRSKLRDTQRIVELMGGIKRLEKRIESKQKEMRKGGVTEKEKEKPVEEKKPVSKKEAFLNLLRELEISAKDLKGVAVITKNGLPIATRLPRDLDVESFAGMAAAMYGAAETTMVELKHSNLFWVYTEAEDSKFVVVGAGPQALLVALVGMGANMGLVLVKLKDTANRVKDLMK